MSPYRMYFRSMVKSAAGMISKLMTMSQQFA